MPRLRSRIAAMAAAVCIAIPVGGPPTAASEPASDESLDAASIAERATYGLGTDAESLARLAEVGDVGSAQFGIAATADELRQLDLTGRTNFQIAAKESVLPYARSLDEYAGAFFDPSQNGNLTILLTRDDPQLNAEIAFRAPAGPRTVTVAQASFSYTELVRAAELIRSLTLESFPQTDIHVVAVDVRSNRVRIEVDESRIGELQSLLQKEPGLGAVGVAVVAGSQATEPVCFRYDCIDPMKAGIQIRKGSVSGNRCTMAFHISMPSGDEQFLTAGHCGHIGSNDWFHEGYGTSRIGSEAATWYVHNGVDVMRVDFRDVQASNLVFGMSGEVVGTWYPDVGETHCASLGVSYTIDCGTITDDYASWTGPACGCTLWGATWSGVSWVDGDSGSPFTLGPDATVATGILAATFSPTTGSMSRVAQVLEHWDANIPCGNPC